jgi:formimidoylglutamate deiminase
LDVTTLHAATALLPCGWADNVRLHIAYGQIERLETGVAVATGDERVGILLPGLCNLHSHAFQRGMAGLAECRGAAVDSFWTWRDVMYRFALALTPEQMEAIAALAYMEMLEAGFVRVGEFHYLHHDRDGQPYTDMGEMAARICSASATAGIGLTLLPVFYAHATFGGVPPHEDQRRFVSSLNGFTRLLEACDRHASSLIDAVVGVAPHSLRAVTSDQLRHVAQLRPQAPLHLHIAEQIKEVDDCLSWSGQRPVSWLLNHASVDSRWCLIHATHMTDSETAALATSGAVAGLCPITEANLGDGVFNGTVFARHGGRFGVGSDSNILIDAAGELRQLEYSQRLNFRARNVMARDQGSTGRSLFDAARNGGAQALGVKPATIAVGARADLLSLNSSDIAFTGRQEDALLDALVFAGGRVDSVWVSGIKRVAAGRHVSRDPISASFAKVLTELLPTL